MRAHATVARRRARLLTSIAAIAGLAWASAPVLAADECGAVAPGGTATCTPAGNTYPGGIFYATPGITVVVQPGVKIDSNVQDGVGIQSTGNLTITTSGAVSVTSTGNNKDGLRADTQSGGNVAVNSTANIVVTAATNSGDGIIARSNLGAVGNGRGAGTVLVTSSGTIDVSSAVGTGISAAGSGAFTDVTVSNSVKTHGATSSPALFIGSGAFSA